MILQNIRKIVLKLRLNSTKIRLDFDVTQTANTYSCFPNSNFIKNADIWLAEIKKLLD